MNSPERFDQDRNKLIEAAIYLSELSLDDPNFAVAKLVKLLYYADCESYMQSGTPITGTTYLHFPHGPHPENWYQVREQMEQNGDVEILYETTVPGYREYRIIPRRAADLDCLSPTDRESLEAQVKRFAGFNAAGIEQYSQQEVGWLSTEDGQPIPYTLAGVFSAPVSAQDILARRTAS